MPGIFISYRREDTSGEAGRLAADFGERFGRSNVFFDIDMGAGIDFEERIHRALETCHVTLVLIGNRWLTVALPDGKRRIDHEGDYVRREIAQALGRPDVAVVPVLVEGARMPSADELPAEISSLAKINAFELSNKRWAYDTGQLARLAQRYERGWRRLLAWLPTWAKRGSLAFALAGAATAAVIAATSGSAGAPHPQARREVLVPATVPPVVDECSSQLRFAVDGTAGPLKCPGGRLNTLAWQYYAKFNLLIMSLGRSTTPGQVMNALCSDLRSNKSTTRPIEQAGYELAALYNGWRFTLPPDVATLRC